MQMREVAREATDGLVRGMHTVRTLHTAHSVYCTPGLRIGISMRLGVDKEVEIEMDEGEGVEGSHKWLLRDAPRLQFGLSMGPLASKTWNSCIQNSGINACISHIILCNTCLDHVVMIWIEY